MRFLVDVQLPLKLALCLRERGEDAIHVLERDLGQATDVDLWQLAQTEERIVISKDEDFFILATRPGDCGQLLWIRIGNTRTKPLLALLNQKWESISAAFSDRQQIMDYGKRSDWIGRYSPSLAMSWL